MHTKWSNQITATRVVTHYSQVDTAQDTWGSKLYRSSGLAWCLPLHHCTSLSQYKTGVNNLNNCGKNTELDERIAIGLHSKCGTSQAGTRKQWGQLVSHTITPGYKG